MSLVRLLTAGKSLIGLEQEPSRYRMRDRFLLPKFGGKNPFTAPVAEEVPVAEPPPEAETGRNEMAPDEIEAANLKETRRLPTPIAPAKPAPMVARPSLISKALGGLKAGVRRLNPLPGLGKSQPVNAPAGRPLPARPGKSAPVQGELSLENIRVVRNDLSDADVEIVASAPAPKPKPRTVASAARTMELAETQPT